MAFHSYYLLILVMKVVGVGVVVVVIVSVVVVVIVSVVIVAGCDCSCGCDCECGCGCGCGYECGGECRSHLIFMVYREPNVVALSGKLPTELRAFVFDLHTKFMRCYKVREVRGVGVVWCGVEWCGVTYSVCLHRRW